MNATLERLLDPQSIIVFDGAMGTMLYSKGVFINQCYDELNLRAPDMVGEIHRQYVEAGANVLETNSFGANRVKLTQHGLQDQVRELNCAAASVARKASRGRALIAGAVGPLGVRLEPYGPTSKDEAREVFQEQIEGLIEGGVDVLIIETFSDLEEIEQAILAARAARDRADDHRRQRANAIRRVAGGRRSRARSLGRGRHRAQLLGRSAGDS